MPKRKDNIILTLSRGDLYNDADSVIKKDYDLGSTSSSCPHCFKGKEKIREQRGLGYPDDYNYHFYCPRVLVSYNEGGYNCTIVCVDCLLEQLKEIK